MAWYWIVLCIVVGLSLFGFCYDLFMKLVGAPIQGGDGFDNQNPN